MKLAPIRVVFMGWIALSQAQALELVLHDVTTSIESAPRDFDYTISDDLGTINGDDTFDVALELTAGLQHAWAVRGSRHGFMLGGQGVFSRALYSGDSSDGSLTGFAVRIEPAYALALTDNVILTCGFIADYGLAELKHHSSVGSANADGTWYRIGALTRLRWKLSRRWAVSADLGYDQASYDLDGDGLAVSLDQRGMRFGLGLNWSVWTAPVRLE